MKKIECNSSLKTIKNQFCTIRAFKRGNPVVSYGFELNRLLTDLKVRKELDFF
jgi:hypothetical protein